ncbi:hypothetical protein [Microcystis aeruginosa]|uniref:hypothetical protein n=1 Tax=Microcystis aeruginosa TaxID=1126 RepID=UPI0011BEB8A6|nr:hypothetical protein [Microcystis aeruginosa]
MLGEQTLQQLLAAAGLAAGDCILGEILAENPLVSNWQLNGIDLSQFPISAIPGISQSAIGNFAEWNRMRRLIWLTLPSIFGLSLFVEKAPILSVRFRFRITAVMIGFFWEGRDS